MSKRKIRLPLSEYTPWSPSKASKATQCPLSFKFNYIDKLPRARAGEAAIVGTAVHSVQEFVLQGTAIDTALDRAVKESRTPMTSVEVEKTASFKGQVLDFAKRIAEFDKKHPIKQMYLEQKWAVDENFKSVPYTSPKAVMRGIVDLALELESGHVVIIDHKSGKKKGIRSYGEQLDIYKVLGLAAFPDAKQIQCAIHFLVDGTIMWDQPNSPSRIREILHPWLRRYLLGCEDGLVGYTERPSFLCGWCDHNEHCDDYQSKKAK